MSHAAPDDTPRFELDDLVLDVVCVVDHHGVGDALPVEGAERASAARVFGLTRGAPRGNMCLCATTGTE